jgi:energy-coupling factor transport system substrate-specific component
MYFLLGMNHSDKQTQKTLTLAFIPLAVGINLGIGALVHVLKLPIYLDSIGTIIAALMLGWRAGAIVGVVGCILISLTIIPPAVYYSGTQVCIALFAHFAGRWGGFRSVPRCVLSGLLLAVIATVVSAPVTYYLFGGITGNGISMFTIYLQSVGVGKAESVLLSGICAELIDKTTQCLTAAFILKRVPGFLLAAFQGGSLHKNFSVR